MKYLKSFNSVQEQKQYMSNHWFTPYVYMFTNKTLDYEQKYIPIEYISSTQTGGQYIDLGCKLMENTDDIKLDIKFNIKGFGKGDDITAQSTLIASQPEVSPYPGFTLRKAGPAKDNRQYVSLCAKWQFENSRADSYNRYYSNILRSPWSNESYNSNTHSTINNIYERSFLLNNIPQSQCHNTNCHLFCALNSSYQPFRFVEADLYYLRFIKGGVIIRDLIPAINKEGIAGLYDKANKKFYQSEGDEEFVAGPSI